MKSTNPDMANGDAENQPPAWWFWSVGGLTVVLSLPYYFSFNTYFSHDDFTILWFHRDWPLDRPWVFFQTDVLTFYRPLQNYLLAALFHSFAMNPAPYCVVLIFIHLLNMVLFGRLVERLFGDRLLTILSVVFFATSWVYWEVVCWKGNYGTALCWLFTMGSCNLFADYCRRRREEADSFLAAGGSPLNVGGSPPHVGGCRWRYAAALGMMLPALLSKETAVNIPLLLTLIAWIGSGANGRTSEAPASPTGQISEGTSPIRGPGARGQWKWLYRLAPFYVLAALYSAFHFLFVRDVYTWLPKGYELHGPVAALVATARSLNAWLTSSAQAALQNLASDRTVGSVLHWFANHSWLYYVLPTAVVAGAVLARSRPLGFGILWAALAFFPASLTADFTFSRYGYGAMMGTALILAQLVVGADRALARRWSLGQLTVARLAGAVGILFFIHANMFLTTTIVTLDAYKCREIADLHEFLANVPTVPPKTLFRVRCLNRLEHFHEGMGLREMFKIALRDDSVEAFFPDQNLTTETLTVLLRDYGKPVEVSREQSGRFTFGIAVPKAEARAEK